MATALQCPACGCKHRLDAVGDTAVFACSRCSRQLKVPPEYRGAATARPGSASSPVPRPRADAPRPAGTRPRRGRNLPLQSSDIRVPLRILGWVVAFILGAIVVRFLAKWTGFVDANTFVDLMLDHSFSTYSRLIVLVPVWALFSTLFATALLEGPSWWARRTQGVSAPPAQRRKPPATRAAAPTAAAATSRPAGARHVPARAAEPAPGSSSTRTRPAVPRVAPTAGAGEAPDQRPRRIPRRETGS